MFHHSPEFGWQRFRRLLAAWVFLLFSAQTLALPEDQAQPIHISADQAVRNEKEGVTVYTGNVRMSQGSLQIEADKIIIYHDDKDADKIIARGKPARLQQQPNPEKGPITASAETIEYYQSAERIHLKTNALIEQDGATVTGQSINYYVAEEKVMADSDVSDDSDRVEVIIPSQALNKDDKDNKDERQSGPAESE